MLKKILYAEDDSDIQTIVQVALWAYSDLDLKICNNGQLLLDCVESYKPDLILLDIMMPVMDGLTTCRRLKLNDKTKNIPVVFLTAKAQVQEIEMYRNVGILGVLIKPFEPSTLANKLQELWAFHKDEEQPLDKVMVL